MYNLSLKNCVRNTAHITCFPGGEKAWAVRAGAGTVPSPTAELAPVAKPKPDHPLPTAGSPLPPCKGATCA